jgi:hypothetical protein
MGSSDCVFAAAISPDNASDAKVELADDRQLLPSLGSVFF